MENKSEIEEIDDNFKKIKIDYTKDMEKEEELEIFKHRDPNVHVFSLPPMSTSKGHHATDFTNLIFKGLMKMTIKGEYMFIYFLNPDNTIFLVSIVDENYDKYIIPTDSSRYFSIRAMNSSGEPNWYGIAFRQRNAAFDFTVTLQDFKQKYNFEKNLKNQNEYKPKYDFSLKPKSNINKPNLNNLSKFTFGKK